MAQPIVPPPVKKRYVIFNDDYGVYIGGRGQFTLRNWNGEVKTVGYSAAQTYDDEEDAKRKLQEEFGNDLVRFPAYRLVEVASGKPEDLRNALLPVGRLARNL